MRHKLKLPYFFVILYQGIRDIYIVFMFWSAPRGEQMRQQSLVSDSVKIQQSNEQQSKVIKTSWYFYAVYILDPEEYVTTRQSYEYK